MKNIPIVYHCILYNSVLFTLSPSGYDVVTTNLGDMIFFVRVATEYPGGTTKYRLAKHLGPGRHDFHVDV